MKKTRKTQDKPESTPETVQTPPPAEESAPAIPAETPTAEEMPKAKRKIWPGAAVRFGDGCPNCGSTRNRIVENYGCTDFGNFGVVERIHECDGENCGWCFKSAQRVPRQDIPHLRPSVQERRERSKAEAATPAA